MLELPGYVWVERLYEGTKSRVQRAVHQPSGRRVVVKLPTSGSPSLPALGWLHHEHRILTRLAPVRGVSRVWAFERFGNSAALVLEDAGLPSLDRVLAERGRLPLDSALRLVLGICRVLSDVHAAGIMHKDIKPQNILVNDTCTEIVLVDFGISSELAEEAAEASLPETLEGTLAYISPEQTGRTARVIDVRTDLYSLGVLFFEVLTGRRPFLENDPLALVYAHLAKMPPAIESLAPDVPSIVARIVERCLAKPAEQRYQTAKGLAADLERALAQWIEQGQIVPFALGQRDFSSKLQIPEILVSRESESQTLMTAFEHAAAGAVELLLLAGPSGVGKTTLVRSVYRQIAKAGRGLLLSGKHDQLGRLVPYAAISQAFSGLLQNLAASPKPVFESWRMRIDSALGKNARVIADLVPELEWLMGPLEPVPVVPIEMMYNRLKLTWIEFVRAVTSASPPLVLFLDDLQWMDPASLELLKTLLTDVGRSHLLIIGAYRDNEVGASHPLWKLFEAANASGMRTSRLTLGPLSEASVQSWLTIALGAESERVKPLSAALHRKTQGNPFFLGQLLLELYRRRRVWRNLEDGAWQWDQDEVERAAATDNVVELMLQKVVELPSNTQALLGQAACAGHSFSFSELGVLAEKTPEELAAELWPALQAGLVIPMDGQYRETQALALAGQGGGSEARYRFLHDRVQQACYERIAPEQRAKTHLWIGRRLQHAFAQQGGSNQKQLELVRHLNLGAAALSTEEERKALARLNLSGAKLAKNNGSYQLQAALVEQAQELLGARAWDEDAELSAQLALERIEADYLLRALESVHRRVEELLTRPLSALSRLVAQELRVRACVAAGQYQEGERRGSSALAEQDIHHPESNEECIAQTLRLIEECDRWLDQHPEGFADMPADPSVEHRLCDALEAIMLVCVGVGTRPALAALMIVRNVHRLTGRAVLLPTSPFFIGNFGHAKSVFLGEYLGGVRWSREAEQAAARLASPFYPESLYYRAHFSPYESPIEEARAYYQRALRMAVASGSFQGTSFALLGELYFVEVWGGRPLSQVLAREESQRDLMARVGDSYGQDHSTLALSTAAFLRASPHLKPPANQEWLRQGSRAFVAKGAPVVAELARLQEVYLFLAFGEYTRALERAEEAERFGAYCYGMSIATDVPLLHALAAAKCVSSTHTQEERAPLLAKLDHAIERFRYFTSGCAENFGHKLRLLEAERARLHDRTEEALLAYDDAIEQAHTQGFLHIEGLAAQFCADFHLGAGRKRLATTYLRQACDAYTSWDAPALISYLETQHSTLLRAANPLPTGEHALPSTITSTTANLALDVNTTIRAAQALSSELDSQRVVEKLMLLVQENSGAQRAALILTAEENLSVAALLSGSQIRVEMAEPLSEEHPVAHTVIQYVLRSREPLVLNDVSTDPRFARDLHLLATKVRSLLAVPLLYQGKLGGILYLEQEAANAFAQERVNLLRVLATQGAIALENAHLYTDLQTANASLEAKVKERTAALDKALKELWSEMDLAKKIQTVLLPQDAQLSGYEMAAVMRPADQVGGDYYDVFRYGARDWVLIGDVSGHGVPAGLCMMIIQTALQTAAFSLQRAGQELTPVQLLSVVNEAMQRNLQQIGQGKYMTITALCLEGGRMRYAGLHQDLLIWRAACREVERIETQGVWLGLEAGDISGLLQDDELSLAEGDLLLLHTDGYTDAIVGGKRIQTEGLARAFAEVAGRGLPIGKLIEGLMERLKEAVVQDDVTLVALRRQRS